MTMHLTSIHTHDLDGAARNAITQLCIAAHQEQDFKNLFGYFPEGGWHYLAFEDGRLASHALLTTRWLQPAGLPVLKTAYVDAVATLPELQGKGYGSAVMRRLADEIELNYEIGCLETERESFYTRLGWKTWRGPLAGRNEQGLVPTPEARGIMILQVSRTPALDLDSTLAVVFQAGGRIW